MTIEEIAFVIVSLALLATGILGYEGFFSRRDKK